MPLLIRGLVGGGNIGARAETGGSSTRGRGRKCARELIEAPGNARAKIGDARAPVPEGAADGRGGSGGGRESAAPALRSDT